MDAIVSQVQTLVQNADDTGRKKVLDKLRHLMIQIEGPQDTMQRLFPSQLELAMVRVGVDLGIFRLLVDKSEPLSVSELAEKTGAAPLLMARILRYLASAGYIEETGKDTFTSNHLTTTATMKGFEGGVYHHFDAIGPAFAALPDWLKKNNYPDIVNDLHTPYQEAFDTKLPGFVHMSGFPEKLANFVNYIPVQYMGMPTWMDRYPLKETVDSLEPDQVLLVDIGGGFGHQSVALRERYPELPNKIINQDIPPVLAQATQHPGVINEAYDFYQPQPVRGAKLYYLRQILHDYPDKLSLQILGNTMSAMESGSRLLVDDIIIPDTGAHWQACAIDLVMMSCLGCRERTSKEWHILLETAGLKITNMYQYTPNLGHTIIECIKA